jgi:hypothetical protein
MNHEAYRIDRDFMDTAADQIAALVRAFVGSSREGFVARRAGGMKLL